MHARGTSMALGAEMGRKILAAFFVLFAATLGVNLLFPRLQNDWSCESSVPSNTAQSAALNDARLRKADVCFSSQRICKFGIYKNADSTLEISLYFAEEDFFAGCVSKGQDLDVLVYSREGSYLRTQEAPFG